jgi:chemotaxis protein methyltransferase CheR
MNSADFDFLRKFLYDRSGLALTPDMLKKYFTKDGEGWKISDRLRGMVKFRNYNLLSDPSATAGFTGLDLIFCRNVLIYFDEITRKRVFTGMAKVMKPGGFLCLGGAETVIGISDAFRILPGERGLFGVTPPAGTVAAAPSNAAEPRPVSALLAAVAR